MASLQQFNSDSLGSIPACVPMGRPSNSSKLRIIGSKIRVDINGKLDLLHVLAQIEVTISVATIYAHTSGIDVSLSSHYQTIRK